jgi:hypothetical protein
MKSIYEALGKAFLSLVSAYVSTCIKTWFEGYKRVDGKRMGRSGL